MFPSALVQEPTCQKIQQENKFSRIGFTNQPYHKKQANMKKNFFFLLLLPAALLSCQGPTTGNSEATAQPQNAVADAGQESVKDDQSQKDIVKTAIGSPDHTTLVKALQQAELVTALSNAGPFTVFAPTNAAFDKLPAGTLDGLMKDDKKADLQNILQYHVALAVYKTEQMHDGQVIGEANGDNITLHIKDGKVTINGTAHIIASIPAANGIIHVIDGVLLPPSK
jgi:uncharacterized surface protein with fasciclin (FAS1) repeats